MISQEVIDRFHSKTSKAPNGCILWTAGKFKNGYGEFYLSGKMRYSHRVAWELTSGPIPDGLLICHTCDVRSCVNPEHLFLGTHTDNNRDKEQKGRGGHSCGEHRHGSKLKTSDVAEIRKSILSQRKLAQRYGVAKGVIQNILNGTKWTKV